MSHRFLRKCCEHNDQSGKLWPFLAELISKMAQHRARLGAPGVPKGDIAHGLYPPPPDLGKAALLYTPAELFWVIKHGIKMTGMPAWSDHSDEETWATVGFIEKLPGMSEQEYASLVMASIAHGGHHSVKSDDRNPSDIRVKP